MVLEAVPASEEVYASTAELCSVNFLNLRCYGTVVIRLFETDLPVHTRLPMIEG